MDSIKNKHYTAFYKIVKTVEMVDGKRTAMYGVEGLCDNEVVTLKALSSDRARVCSLIDTMNECELELCQLKDVVDDFLYEYNKSKREREK